jgi:hypothetical protein
VTVSLEHSRAGRAGRVIWSECLNTVTKREGIVKELKPLLLVGARTKVAVEALPDVRWGLAETGDPPGAPLHGSSNTIFAVPPPPCPGCSKFPQGGIRHNCLEMELWDVGLGRECAKSLVHECEWKSRRSSLKSCQKRVHAGNVNTWCGWKGRGPDA